MLSALNSGRLAHAYALVGSEHEALTAFALDFARVLGADPILDVFVLESGEAISVEQARTAAARLAMTPVGKYKVAVISSDLLTEQAANAFLKLLEEPPAKSLIFLTAVNFYNLLPTVASRVQKIMFSGKRKWDEPELGNYYEVLQTGDLVTRLQTAEKLAALEKPEVKRFVEFSMDRFCESPMTARIGAKLLAALSDLERNVNLKLALDNLFLP